MSADGQKNKLIDLINQLFKLISYITRVGWIRKKIINYYSITSIERLIASCWYKTFHYFTLELSFCKVLRDFHICGELIEPRPSSRCYHYLLSHLLFIVCTYIIIVFFFFTYIIEFLFHFLFQVTDLMDFHLQKHIHKHLFVYTDPIRLL